MLPLDRDETESATLGMTISIGVCAGLYYNATLVNAEKK